jgi:hypothetical protein
VVIPGLYDPKQPQVFISGFYDILELMASKRKPRRMKILVATARATTSFSRVTKICVKTKESCKV